MASKQERKNLFNVIEAMSSKYNSNYSDIHREYQPKASKRFRPKCSSDSKTDNAQPISKSRPKQKSLKKKQEVARAEFKIVSFL